MCITGHKVYNGQHQNLSGHHPSFFFFKLVLAEGREGKKEADSTFVLPTIETL
jgi:hypothetical protein